MTDEARRGPLSTLARQEENNAPMMAIFGGMFALMLVFLLLVNVFSARTGSSAWTEGPGTW